MARESTPSGQTPELEAPIPDEERARYALDEDFMPMMADGSPDYDRHIRMMRAEQPGQSQTPDSASTASPPIELPQSDSGARGHQAS